MASHLILPYISLTSSSTTSQASLLEAFPSLYLDLTTVEVEKLLDLDRPALNFISPERFKASNFPEPLLVPARKVLSENFQLACKVFKLLLPRLAKGWERQRGDEYSFGSNPDMSASDRVLGMDQKKLEQAPINNLDPEGGARCHSASRCQQSPRFRKGGQPHPGGGDRGQVQEDVWTGWRLEQHHERVEAEAGGLGFPGP